MRVRFWGTRGSIPTPEHEALRYGGNTSCVEVETDDGTLLILDCGTGARRLGLMLAERGAVRAHVLIGHTHHDHINGLPFFLPAFMEGSHLTIYGPAGIDRSLPTAIGGQMDYAYFPVPLKDLTAQLAFEELGESEFSLGEIRVRTQYLNHTSPTIGYRIEVGGATLVYATDHEPHAATLWHPDRPSGLFQMDAMLHPADARHATFLKDADLVIHDAQYTQAEYATKLGWGHSPMEYAVDVALAAGVKRLALFHHDPGRKDDAVDRLMDTFEAYLVSLDANLELRAAAENSELYLPETAALVAGHNTFPHAPRLPTRARILVAEDDEDLAAVLSETLQDDGYEVMRVADGLSAVRLAHEQHFDLMLLDIAMPMMDGLTVCRQLRDDTQFARVPILILTASNSPREIEAAFEEGATDYMTKPFAIGQLRARVRTWLTRPWRDTGPRAT